MIPTRIFALVAGVLSTASLLFVIAYWLPVPRSAQAVAGTLADSQSTPD
jgi:hypothetical protein